MWCPPVIPSHRRRRQEDPCEFKASLDDIARPCLEKMGGEPGTSAGLQAVHPPISLSLCLSLGLPWLSVKRPRKHSPPSPHPSPPGLCPRCRFPRGGGRAQGRGRRRALGGRVGHAGAGRLCLTQGLRRVLRCSAHSGRATVPSQVQPEVSSPLRLPFRGPQTGPGGRGECD